MELQRDQSIVNDTGNNLKNKVIAAALAATSLIGLNGSSRNMAHAESGPVIKTMNLIDQNGTQHGYPTSPSIVNPDGNPAVSVLTGDGGSLLYSDCINNCADPAPFKKVVSGFYSTEQALIVTSSGKRAVFFNGENSTGLAVCQDAPVCNNWEQQVGWSVQGRARTMEVKNSPDGGVGVLYSVNDSQAKEIHYKKYNADLSQYKDYLISKSKANKVSLAYDPVTGNPRASWTNGRDSMIAISPNSNFDPGTPDNPTPATITALEATGRPGSISGDIEIVNPVQGVRAVYGALETTTDENNETHYNFVTRTASCLKNPDNTGDENCDTNGAHSATVDSSTRTGLGTDTAVLQNSSIESLVGADRGLVQVVFPPENNDGMVSNWVYTIDGAGSVRDPSLDIAPNGTSAAAYLMNINGVNELRVATGANETLGVNPASQGTAQQPSNTRPRTAANDTLPVGNPNIPIGPNYQIASNIRYTVGKKVVDLCLALTSKSSNCDYLWHANS